MSPAIVPRTCGWPARSISSASALAKPDGVVTTTRLPLDSTAERHAAEARAEVARPRVLGRGVDEPAGGVAHLHEPELADVARHGRLHDVVAGGAQRVGELGLGRDALLADEAQDRALALAPIHASTSSRIDEGVVDFVRPRRRAAARGAGRARRR